MKFAYSFPYIAIQYSQNAITFQERTMAGFQQRAEAMAIVVLAVIVKEV